MATKNPLNRIKSGAFSRGLSLAKVSLAAGARVAGHAVGNLFTNNEEERIDRYKAMLSIQMEALSQELGQLKGSLMKVGQLLSMYGEHFLPPEANAFLKSLQNQSPPLAWEQIRKTIERQLPPETLQGLEIDRNPLASASLGQVHRAFRKSDGAWFAMKIQYPGVDRAIDGDLKALKSILSISKLIPKGPKYDELFKEVRQMLHQEVDYRRELEITQEFKKLLANDSRFIIPEVIPKLSTRRILTTSLELGFSIDSPEVQSLSQERRNALGAMALELYFKELFEFGAVQTDPHFGNYRVRLREESENDGQDRLVLLDFGAVRKLPKHFLNPYLKMVSGAHLRDAEKVLQGAKDLGFIHADDTEEMKKIFVELCYLISEPFLPSLENSIYFDKTGSYHYGESDLPLRVAKKAANLALAFKFRTPPREIVFLDRKLGGVFVFLSVLKAELRGEEIVAPYLTAFEQNQNPLPVNV